MILYTSGSRWVWIAAFLGPALILGAAYLALVEAPIRAAVNQAGEPRGEFECQEAHIVVVGSSRAASDIDLTALTALLSPPERNAMVAMVHGSNAPVWYAVLKNGIFARGCRPELVIVYDIIDKILAADVLPDERVRLLAPYLTDDEPVIHRKIFRKEEDRGRWQRSREYVVSVRQRGLEQLAAWATGMMFSSSRAGTRIELGRRVLDHAFDGVFAPEKLEQKERAERILPVVEAVDAPRELLPAGVEQGFLADIVALADAYGTKVLFARAPVPPSRSQTEKADRRLVQDAIRLIESVDAYYVDMGEQPVADAWYADVRHMNALGRMHNTRALASRIRAKGVFSGEGAEGLAQGGMSPGGVVPGGPTSVEASPGGSSPGGLAGIGSEIRILEGEVVYAAPLPPPVPIPTDRIEPGPGGTGIVRSPHLAFLADDACEKQEVLACCSPMRIAENGVPLPAPNVQRADVEREGHGRYAHVGNELVFSSTDGSAPATNGRDYSLFMEPTRRCQSYWLYPGDTARFPDIGKQLARAGATWESLGRMDLWGRIFSADEGDASSDDGGFSLRIRLTVDGQIRVDDEIGAGELSMAPRGWDISPPLTSADVGGNVVLEISNPATGGYFLLTYAVVS